MIKLTVTDKVKVRLGDEVTLAKITAVEDGGIIGASTIQGSAIGVNVPQEERPRMKGKKVVAPVISRGDLIPHISSGSTGTVWYCHDIKEAVANDPKEPQILNITIPLRHNFRIP